MPTAYQQMGGQMVILQIQASHATPTFPLATFTVMSRIYQRYITLVPAACLHGFV